MRLKWSEPDVLTKYADFSAIVSRESTIRKEDGRNRAKRLAFDAR